MVVCGERLCPLTIEKVRTVKTHSATRRKTNKQPFSRLVFIAIALITVAGCGIFDGASGPRAIPVESPTLTIAWAPPVAGRSEGAISAYRVYARARGSSIWRHLGSVEPTAAPSFSITIGESSLGYGSYELAVSTVARGGAESARHSSLDWDADPASGWYVDWY